MKKRIEIAFLVVVVGLLGYYGYERIGIRMGGTPSSIQSRFTSEEQWMVETILRDIAEAAAYAHGVPVEDVRLDVTLDPAGAFELPSVHVGIGLGGIADVQRALTLERSFWTPENYAPLAAELLGPISPRDEPDADVAFLEALLEPTPTVLLAESERITARLRADIRDPLAHEQASVLLGAFGMREAAYGFDDKRFLLLRMTSHLAIARALRADAALSATGQLGEAALLALTGRQVEFLAKLNAWSAGEGSTAIDSWKSALYMYSTEDWRRDAPPEDLLVQLMQFRAMLTSVGASTAIERLGAVVSTDVVEFGRLLSWYASGDVVARGFIESQIGNELAQAQEVALAHFGKGLSPQELSDALNEHPGGMVGADGPQALDWGMWAAFFQRHICGAALSNNQMLRGTLGSPDSAMTFGREIELVLAGLEMNPMVQVSRTRYVGGRVEDTIGMDGAIAFTRKHPELVNPTRWRNLQDTAGQMMRKRGMPDGASWLSSTVLVTSALDSTGHRLEIFEPSVDVDEALAAMTQIAPQHTFVLHEVVARMKTVKDDDAYRKLSEQLGTRVEFDIHALRDLLALATLDEDRVEVFGQMCDFDANECAGLGWELAYQGRDPDALAAFERFVDGASSGLRVCNNANWLVNYYYDHGRQGEALALADQVEGVFCSWGIRTKAYLLERMGRVAQAERLYLADAERYEYDAPVAPPLLGFYYRRVRIEGDSGYESRFEGALAQIFRSGLEPLPEESGTSAPAGGVLIDGGSKKLEDAGLRGGDVIVGVDGWQVHTLDQYDAVTSFRAKPGNERDMQLRVWRQTSYIDVEADVRARLFDVRVRTFGTPGPSYQWR